MQRGHLPKKIRVSVGSATVLGLIRGMLDARPTTIYLLTYRLGKCSANCGFCPQAKTSKSRADMLSRVTWPPFSTEQVLSKIKHTVKGDVIKRICLQALNYPTVFDDILSLAKDIMSRVKVPLSVSCQPLEKEQMITLAETGVDRVSIALDAATKELFDKVKGPLADGPYVWEKQRKALEEAVQTFGKDRVTTHLIAGLGETEKEIISMIQWCVDLGVYPSLFAFTPIPGTALGKHPQPALCYYRRVQVARHLVVHRKTRYENMTFNQDGRFTNLGIPKDRVWEVIKTGSPFLTSGCPGCNRPYYNERPGGPMYNYPRPPSLEEITEIEKQVGIWGITFLKNIQSELREVG